MCGVVSADIFHSTGLDGSGLRKASECFWVCDARGQTIEVQKEAQCCS